MSLQTLLVTGAAGFIGSHTVVELLSNGFNVIGVDNFSNSSLDVITRIEKIKTEVLENNSSSFELLDLDVRNQGDLLDLFKKKRVDGVIHFAGLKAVKESFLEPLEYWDNNVGGTLSLLSAMNGQGVKNLIFSSSALVYGLPQVFPITEDSVNQALSPYANTKLTCELFLKDFVHVNSDWNIVLLRYFNPVGAHPSGWLGEMPKGVPNNLMPLMCQVAAGLREKLFVFGNDFNTPDGTCIRDYIHVTDLARGHLAALKAILPQPSLISSQDSHNGLQVFNFGTGQGVSVKDMLKTFQEVTGVKVAHEYVDRRDGDVPVLYADVNKAFNVLNWKAKKSLEDMCKDAWRWQQKLMA
jgi:UDP-glucose 4-epimerase